MQKIPEPLTGQTSAAATTQNAHPATKELGRTRARSMLLLALGLILLFVALAWDVKDHGLAWSCDHPLASFVHNHVNSVEVSVCSWITQLGSVPVLAPVAVALGCGLFFFMKRVRFALAVALAAAGSIALGTGLKDLVGRARPVAETFYAPRPGYSFPSGHTLGACIIFGITALTLSAVTKNRRARQIILITYIVIVLAVAASLLIIGVHYLTDVLGALLIGPAWLLTVWSWVLWRVKDTGHDTDAAADASRMGNAGPGGPGPA